MQRGSRKGLFVTGTDTGVGKTLVAAALAALLCEQRKDVGVMKPVETGDQGDRSDAAFLQRAAGVIDDMRLICPYSFPQAVAPMVAAEGQGMAIELATILSAFDQLAWRHNLMLVEGVGGLLCPLSPTLFVSDLAEALGLPLLVVARGGLGTINHTLLTLRAAEALTVELAGLVICHTEPAQDLAARTNATVIKRLCQVPIWGEIPYEPGHGPLSGGARSQEFLADLARKYLNISQVFEYC